MAEVALATLGPGGSSNANVAKIAIEQRKKKTDVVEPQVISEDLLVQGVDEPKKPDEEPWDPIEFPQVTSLRLSFLNIIEIANLNNFDSLTTLRLDNNIIDKIANLSHLRNLTWLDLSFNNIREIEGLEGLTKLLDLSLYHNQIEEIKGLDGCKNLNIVSLGHNNIKDLKQVDYLRKFQNLRCLCLADNRVCQNDSYTQHVYAYLSHLKYLDYMLIDRKAITQAQEGYNLDELGETKEREIAEQNRLRQLKEKEETLARLREAFLDATEDLFEELFKPMEVEPEHVTALTCYTQLKEDYKDQVSDQVKWLRSSMEDRNESRSKKTAAFEKAVAAAEKESEHEAFDQIKQFRAVMKRALKELEREDSGRAEADKVASALDGQLSDLENFLMASEIQLQESIEEATSDFDGKINEIIKAMTEKATEFFQRLAEIEKKFYADLVAGSKDELEAAAQNSDLTNLTEDESSKKALLRNNPEEMNTAIVNFGEAHNTLIQNKEDYMTSQMTSWHASFFNKHRERQYNRNRQRIMDIKKVIDECRAEISAAAEAGDDDEDDHEGNVS